MKISRQTAGKIKDRIILSLLVVVIGAQQCIPISTSAQVADTWTEGRFPVLADAAPRIDPLPCYNTSFTYQSFTKADNTWSDAVRYVERPVCATKMSEIVELGKDTSGAESGSFIATGYAYRTLSSTGSPISFSAVPGNNGAFIYSYSSADMYASSTIGIGYNFSAHGEFGKHLVSLSGTGSRYEMAYMMTNQPQPLKTDDGKVMPFHASRKYSNDGKWLIVEAGNLGIVRVNMMTKEMLMIDPSYRPQYGMGWTPRIELAITDDGNTAMVGNALVDLRACQRIPIVQYMPTTAVPGCKWRQVRENLNGQLPGFDSFIGLKFSNDGQQLTGRAIYYVNGAIKTKDVKYSVYGYAPPANGYIALGDSFSSGEGAYNYITDIDSGDPRNRCHVSKDSYPYMAAITAAITDFHNVACSGAQTSDYYTGIQYDNALDRFLWTAGEDPQSVYLNQRTPNIVTISMIGNDIGFAEMLKWCAVRPDSCHHFKEDRQALADEIHSKFDTLVGLYDDIELKSAEGARVYF